MISSGILFFEDLSAEAGVFHQDLYHSLGRVSDLNPTPTMPPGTSGSAFQLPSGRWQEVIDLDLALKTDFQRVGAYILDL